MSSLRVPVKYIQALVDAYPRPITQSELAQKSSVTKSAISKTRNTLLELCDEQTIIYKKRLVLKSDFDTFIEIFHVYFLQSITEELLGSEYAETVLNPTQIYDKLSQGLKDFSFAKYFDKEDVTWAINLILQNISYFRIQKSAVGVIAAALHDEIEDENLTEIIPYIQLISKLFNNFEINIKDQEELKKTLVLRDKVYFFIKNNIVKVITNLDVIKEIADSEEKRSGIKLLSKIAENIMNKTSNGITEYLQQQAKAKEIPFPKEYKEGGTFLKVSAGR